MTSKSLFNALVLVGIFLAVAWFAAPRQDPNAAKPVEMNYSELVQTLDSAPGSIKSITVLNGSNQVRVETDKGVATVVVPSKAGEEVILRKASDREVKVLAKDASSEAGIGDILLSLVGSILPMLLIFGLIFFFISRMAARNGPGQMSEEMAKRMREVKPSADKKTFKDVAGCDEAKVEAQEIIDYLRNPGYFAQFGARPPRGVLLVGPPGTGKTLLAKAIAGEADAAFFSVTASEFVEMFVGVGASRVRALFNDARKNKPSIIFIDEIDAVGRQRGAGIGGGHDEREQTLNQLLTEMDGFSSNDAVVLMAATNRPDVLDPALIRPGRFDRQILVDAPDVDGREAIFKIHTRNKPLAAGLDLRLVAERTPGFTGAEIEGACNEAATVAFRRFDLKARELKAAGKGAAEINALPRVITLEDFDEGIDRVVMGVAKTSRAKTMSEQDKTNTSIHELGHALISELIEGGDPVAKITIVPRARALGYTQSLPTGDRYGYTIKNLVARIMMAMGGRAAQEVLLGTIDTGASNDFQQAYGIARRMVTEWGMSSLGPISVSGNDTNPFLGRSMAMGAETGPELSNAIDREVRCIVDTCLTRAKELIGHHADFMWAANGVLMKKETLLAPDWRALLEQHKIERHNVKLDLACEKICKHGKCDGEAHEEPAAPAVVASEAAASETPAA